MDHLGINAIHPTAPEYLTAAALFTAPIDVGAAVARIRELWGEDIDPQWVNIDAAQTGGLSGELLTFQLQGVHVMITPVVGQLQIDKGQLPEHHTHVAITLFAPLSGLEDGKIAGEHQMRGENASELMRRHRMVSAHIAYTQVADALMREDAAIGVYRHELGVIHPPQMVSALADSLTHGQAPLPLWINVRLGDGPTTRARTLGLPLFGHLDLEVTGDGRTLEETAAVVESTANYIVMGDSYLLPGQTIGAGDGGSYPVTQEVSVADGSTVIRIVM
ncbi:DUF4261 domain-containing protein [Arcanobacterium haemolyticum]|uniref:DUF4261 domain-containing protein n=1 Tax=Arcanobacterium haemolyticum (strain ATCC 9345 / DSM 20595 / CCM 5947 / CCUG 17215 / LMG 16163 / NBRC 15585 / NCTC 8452 / 11018) TaxID=644284 RepID=D7BLD6_ARCHD|nr:DUF4261 domain-containing protein [Arcanobacterium haemolyticum]ADH93466.1 hypothetical protein Arch_1787 [Arcanobacterium haemolyticum DSM 20595]SQH27524.1 Uncharacterised protein [Arcanobacterium haemolyticum]